MGPWIACVIYLILVLSVWFFKRNKPRAKWTLIQKILFTFFVIGGVVDTAFTHVVVNILEISVEMNPIFGPGFDPLPAILLKGEIILFCYLFLGIDFSKLSGKCRFSKKSYKTLRYTVLIGGCCVHWGVSFFSGIDIWGALFD